MPRPRKGRVGRSAGVAEHRRSEAPLCHQAVADDHHSPARARSRASSRSRSRARRRGRRRRPRAGRSRALAPRSTRPRTEWFAAQRQAADLDVQIQTLDQDDGPVERHVDKLRTIADARAVELYESNTQALGGMMSDSAMGGDPLELGRRAALIGQANSDGQAAIDQLEASIADLTARRNELHAARTRAGATAAGPRRPAPHPRHGARLARAAARPTPRPASELAAAIRRQQDEATARPRPRPTVVALTSAAPSTPAPAPAAATPRPAPPAGSGGVSPHHDEPFLVCTRARESDGDYSVVSPAALLRRVPVRAHHLERHGVARRPARPRRRAAVAGVGVRPGRDGVGALPVAGQRALGRSLLAGQHAVCVDHVGERAVGE